MLSAIRSLARSPFAVLIIIVPLLAAFALFGVTDVFRVGATSAVTVGSEQISVRELGSAYSRQLRQIQQENPRFTREEAEEIGLPEQVLSQLVAQAAVDAKADELGLGISNEEVREQITAIEAFNNPFTGRFDREAYRSALSNAGYTVAEFEASVREDLVRSQLVVPLTTGIAPPQVMGEVRRAFLNERRTIEALFLSPSLVGDIPDPTTEELQLFIEENARFFQRPELRRLTLVRLAPDLVIRDVEVAEEDLRELYEIRLENGELAEPATRSLRHWGAPDEATAQAAAEHLGAGEDPQAVAAEFELGEPVDLDGVQGFEIPDSAIASAAFDIGAGEAAAIEARLGWRVVYIDEASDPVAPSLEEARDELRDELAEGRASEIVLDRLAEFEELRAGGLALAEAAAQASIPVERFDFVAQSGVTEEGIPVQGLADHEAILTAAFELPEGFDSDAMPYGDGGYFVVRVDAVDPSRLPEVEEVREQAETFWRFRQVDDRLHEQVEAAIARVEAGESLNSIADDLGAGARVETATLLRSETAGPFNQQLVQQAFGAGLDQPFETRAADQRTQAIAVVTEIIPPEAGAVTPDGAQELAIALERDLSQLIQTGLLRSYEVRRNEAVIDQAPGRSELP